MVVVVVMVMVVVMMMVVVVFNKLFPGFHPSLTSSKRSEPYSPPCTITIMSDAGRAMNNEVRW